KERLRRLTARRWSVTMEERIEALNRFSRGWTAYFAYADTPSPFIELDKWLRRRLRQVRWTEWKQPATRRRKLRALGLAERQAHEAAGSRHGPWRLASTPPLQHALSNAYWQALGLHGFHQPYRRFRDTLPTA